MEKDPLTPLSMRIRLFASPVRLLIVTATIALAACVEQSPTAVAPEGMDRGRAVIIIGPPPPSCTYTQGYWKNSSELWDDAGDGMVFLTSDAFYNSGVSYLTILRLPPKGGNAYELLAHQFIAASLNLNGAFVGIAEVDDAMAGAAAYFSGEPAGIPDPVEPTRSQLISWANTLDEFNRGIIGPGHCS
jgi:hypothetical protein